MNHTFRSSLPSFDYIFIIIFSVKYAFRNKPGTSLVVLWLRLHASAEGVLVQSMIRNQDPACQFAWPKIIQQINPGGNAELTVLRMYDR